MNDVWMNHVKMCNIIAHFQSARDMQNKGKNVKIKIEGKKKNTHVSNQTSQWIPNQNVLGIFNLFIFHSCSIIESLQDFPTHFTNLTDLLINK